MLAEKLPKLQQHFTKHGVDPALFTLNWFLCVFVDTGYFWWDWNIISLFKPNWKDWIVVGFTQFLHKIVFHFCFDDMMLLQNGSKHRSILMESIKKRSIGPILSKLTYFLINLALNPDLSLNKVLQNRDCTVLTKCIDYRIGHFLFDDMTLLWEIF